MEEQQITKSLELPFQFDREKLVSDLSLITDQRWISHFNTGGYHGEWNVIPLYAVNGDATDIFALPSHESVISETPIMNDCNYLKEVIDTFKFPILTARLLRLGAGAEIKPHRDHQLGYEDGNFRLHIPITTNKHVQFILDGKQLSMQPGECWYTNVNYVHSVSNQGQSDRVHLVIDGKRNAWSDDLFFSMAPAESFFAAQTEEYSPETIGRIIEELKRSNHPANEQLLIELRARLEVQSSQK